MVTQFKRLQKNHNKIQNMSPETREVCKLNLSKHETKYTHKQIKRFLVID